MKKRIHKVKLLIFPPPTVNIKFTERKLYTFILTFTCIIPKRSGNMDLKKDSLVHSSIVHVCYFLKRLSSLATFDKNFPSSTVAQ